MGRSRSQELNHSKAPRDFSAVVVKICFWLISCSESPFNLGLFLFLLRNYPMQFGEALADLVERCPNQEPGIDFTKMHFESMVDGLGTKCYHIQIMWFRVWLLLFALRLLRYELFYHPTTNLLDLGDTWDDVLHLPFGDDVFFRSQLCTISTVLFEIQRRACGNC